MKMGQQRTGYSKKRKFKGNQFSVSSKCLKTSETSTASTSDENVRSQSEDQALQTRVCQLQPEKLVQLTNQLFDSSVGE